MNWHFNYKIVYKEALSAPWASCPPPLLTRGVFVKIDFSIDSNRWSEKAVAPLLLEINSYLDGNFHVSTVSIEAKKGFKSLNRRIRFD